MIYLTINGGNGQWVCDCETTREEIEYVISSMQPGDNICYNHVTHSVYPSSMTPGGADIALAYWWHGDSAPRRLFTY